MGTKSKKIPVYTVDVFTTDKTSFWMGNWGGVTNRHPHLKLLHKPMFYSLIHVEEPGESVVIDNEEIALSPLNIICIKPGSICKLNIGREVRGHMICFAESFFSLRYNSNVLQRFGFLGMDARAELNFQEGRAKKWDALVALMFDEYSEQHSEQVLRSYLNILLNEVERQNARPVISERLNGKLDKVAQFEKLVEAYYTSLKMPAAYADKLYITTNYLNRLCQEYRGITAGELIRKRIVLEAQRLLHHTHLSVGEIACQLGFESLSYFVTFFKKKVGLTPEMFRTKEN